MDDWSAPAPEPHEIIGPQLLLRSQAADPAAVEALAGAARRRASTRDRRRRRRRRLEGWAALIALAERLELPGLPGAVRRARPASRRTTRCSPATCPRAAPGCARRSRRYDAVLSSAPARSASTRTTRARWSQPDTRLALVTQDPEEAHRSPVELAVLGDPAAVCAALAEAVDARAGPPTPQRTRARRRRRRSPASRCAPATSSHALADRLPRDAILLEETPSSAAPSCTRASPPPRRSGFVSAMGMLGFALPAAIGVRHGAPRPARARRRRRRLVASTRSRRCGARPPTRPACCSSSCATAATRS